MLSVPGLAAQSSCLRPVWLYSYDSLVWPEAVMRTEGREQKLCVHALQKGFIHNKGLSRAGGTNCDFSDRKM